MLLVRTRRWVLPQVAVYKALLLCDPGIPVSTLQREWPVTTGWHGSVGATRAGCGAAVVRVGRQPTQTRRKLRRIDGRKADDHDY
jgi:hypothetical protein